jgi:hypothetical protein
MKFHSAHFYIHTGVHRGHSDIPQPRLAANQYSLPKRQHNGATTTPCLVIHIVNIHQAIHKSLHPAQQTFAKTMPATHPVHSNAGKTHTHLKTRKVDAKKRQPMLMLSHLRPSQHAPGNPPCTCSMMVQLHGTQPQLPLYTNRCTEQCAA